MTREVHPCDMGCFLIAGTVSDMEAARHREPRDNRTLNLSVSSRLPQKGAAWRILGRKGARAHARNRVEFVSGALPSIRCLAKELCAQRGFDNVALLSLPAGGAITEIADLHLDRSLVLLSLSEDARIYTDRAFDVSQELAQALSIRVVEELESSSLEAMVRDLVNGRAVIVSSGLARRIRKERALVTPIASLDVSLP